MTFFETVAIISPVLSIAFAFFAFRRNQKADDSSTAREMGTILTEIGYIKSQITALDKKFDNSDERYVKYAEQMAGLKQSIERAHDCIDALMDKLDFKGSRQR